MKNLYCAFLSCTLVLSIANQSAIGASAEPAEGSVRSRQLTHSRYKPDDGSAVSKRDMAKAAAVEIFTRLCKDGITPYLRQDTSPGLINYDMKRGGEPYLFDGKPLNILISYHYRRDGRFPFYKPEVFTQRWIAEQVNSCRGAGELQAENLSVVCAASVLNESNVTSFHILDRNAERLARTYEALKEILSFADRVPSPPRTDVADDDTEGGLTRGILDIRLGDILASAPDPADIPAASEMPPPRLSRNQNLQAALILPVLLAMVVKAFQDKTAEEVQEGGDAYE